MADAIAGLALIASLASSDAARQRSIKPETVYRWMNEVHLAVEQYRSGDITAALTILAQRTANEQQLVAEQLPKFIELPNVSPVRRDDRGQPMVPWKDRDIYTLASLHMEAALQVYLGRGPVERLRAHFRTAEPLFAATEALRVPGRLAAAHWKLVIGTTALADAQAWWAEQILGPACDDHPDYGGLLLACGSLYETVAMLPAHMLVSWRSLTPRMEAPAFTWTVQDEYTAARRRYLAEAWRRFEQLLEIDRADREGQLRLAHVRLLSGDAASAVPLLEGLLAGPDTTDVRAAYLARLFLGRVRHQSRQFDAAATLFQQAIDLVPSGQSAWIALAHAFHAGGSASRAAGITSRMLERPAERSADPWWGYPFGPFWVTDPLLAALRDEARQ